MHTTGHVASLSICNDASNRIIPAGLSRSVMGATHCSAHLGAQVILMGRTRYRVTKLSVRKAAIDELRLSASAAGPMVAPNQRITKMWAALAGTGGQHCRKPQPRDEGNS